ncbi:uncharacterized protein B0T15DRAFT_520897 [Chaetomium strumarium]|uniref:Diphthine--ammonia ligase n=1 Tax=Chaetomium strumarium TaxID=1170767 RepID=A0AAJ0M704_9PEZI|nr:hypothetical protein B0T15DRAFT_520897 [Chaetomium strumarium]
MLRASSTLTNNKDLVVKNGTPRIHGGTLRVGLSPVQGSDNRLSRSSDLHGSGVWPTKMASTRPDGLNVIALVSGGKDSFFSLLHCRANGHRVVALANLHPAPLPVPHRPRAHTRGSPGDASAAPAASAPVSTSGEGHAGGVPGNEVLREADEDERDLNSFMYQTVGHEVIALYAEATGLPLYRQAITGSATQHGKEYSHYQRSLRSTSSDDGEGPLGLGPEDPAAATSPNASAEGAECRAAAGGGIAPEDPDETESMIPLLEAVKKAHPEANAICAGAILSTYQRTRVESVATRLGLTPLAYLWKFPVLPAPGLSDPDPAARSDAQLLDDMAAGGMEARIIKVASGGLDESFLWTNVASAAGKSRLARAMRRFGTAETGAVIGEGGEFETLVVDGPPTLFKKRIVVAEEDRRVVKEDGGSAWLRLCNASLQDKGEESTVAGMESSVRIPDLLDQKFVGVLGMLASADAGAAPPRRLWPETEEEAGIVPRLATLQASTCQKLQPWCFASSNRSATIEEETQSIVKQIRQRLRQHSLPPSAILSATVTLRRMADFPIINGIYGTLFNAPNPPSRVTISCGDALSTATAGANIAVYLTVHTALPPAERQGLHVQSRSYWAPANIGPYSQAISIPVASLGPKEEPDVRSLPSGPRLVSIAGQIPLVPATMSLPERGDDSEEDALKLQLTLSLQHLWRIGVEMGVQWWTSAVAYFPRCAVSPSASDEGGTMVHRARLASAAWRTAHLSSSSSDFSPDGEEEEEEEEDEGGPDLWDRRYNPQYMTYSSFGGAESGKVKALLPDRSVLAPFRSVSTDRSDAVPVVPPLFVAEVDELPRAAGVEWHAHLGVGHAEEESVTLRELHPSPLPGGEEGKTALSVSQVIVRDAKEAGRASFVQTIVAEPILRGVGHCQLVRHGIAARDALTQLGTVDLETGEPAALVRYADVELLDAGREATGTGTGTGTRTGMGPVVPCRSLWDSQGQRLAAVTVYHSVFC